MIERNPFKSEGEGKKIFFFFWKATSHHATSRTRCDS